MQLNMSKYPSFLTIETPGLPPSAIYPVFVLGLTTYCLVLFFNFTILLTITFNRQLHKPMYLLLINLPINDMMGATGFYPQIMTSILSQDQTISQVACFLQVLLVHLYSGGTLLILTAMAYDRYIAICCPLRYSATMTPSNVAKIIAAVWLTDIILVGTLIFLLARFRFCRSVIADMCSNQSLMKLICEDISINNYYGLFTAFFLQGLALFAMFFTYIHVLVACLVNKRADTKTKAIKTCATHLLIFIIYEVSTLVSVLSERLTKVSPLLKKSLIVTIIVLPPILNPIIYGLNTYEIKSKIIHCLNKKVSPFFLQKSPGK